MLVQEDDSSFLEIINHYRAVWNSDPNFYLMDRGPIHKLPYNFRVLEFEPTPSRNMWTYATCGMSSPSDPQPLELHIFSPQKDTQFIDLLTAIAYYHHNTKKVGLNHSFNFGKPLAENSLCTHGFISQPFLDGPALEDLSLKDINTNIKFYWIIPITEAELNYKKKYGSQALEDAFEKNQIRYVDFFRESVV